MYKCFKYFVLAADLDIYIGLPRSEQYRAADVYSLSPLSINFLTSYSDWPRVFRMIAFPDSIYARIAIGMNETVRTIELCSLLVGCRKLFC